MRPETAGRLLAISWEMPPLSGPRAVQVTRTLVELGLRGWRSRVVCFGPRSTRYQQDFTLDVEAVSEGVVRLVRVASPEEAFFFRALWRLVPPVKHLPDEKRVWVPRALAAARRLLAEEPTDVIVSFARPWSDHLVGLQLHRETGLPWVAHFSDPWVDNPYERGPAWQRRRCAAMERAVIEAATQVAFVNRQTADRVMAKYPDAWRSRVHVVPQGFEPRPAAVSRVTGRSVTEAAGLALSEPEGRVEGLRIVYTGRFYDGIRTPEAFLQALAALHREASLDGRLTVEFVGAGMDGYERRARELGVDGLVRFAGRMPPEAAQQAAAGADVLLVIDAPSDGPSLFLPSKLVDYLPLRVPILGITPPEGPTADLLAALGYPVVAPDDVAGIGRALAQLLDAQAAGTLRASAQHDEVSAAYDIRETTRAFAEVLDTARGAR
ncbi:MAG: glycosyltransferase [Vicinamibacterales bacterium]|nr:glycosyltransferase [Vicinamibacterales bacterium]